MSIKASSISRKHEIPLCASTLHADGLFTGSGEVLDAGSAEVSQRNAAGRCLCSWHTFQGLRTSSEEQPTVFVSW